MAAALVAVEHSRGGDGGDGGGGGGGGDVGGTQNIMKNCTVLASRFMVYKWVTYQKE